MFPKLLNMDLDEDETMTLLTKIYFVNGQWFLQIKLNKYNNRTSTNFFCKDHFCIVGLSIFINNKLYCV